MKWIVLASVLAFGAPAIAQDQTTTGTGSPATQSQPMSPPRDQTAPTGQTGMQPGTMTDQPGQTGTMTDQTGTTGSTTDRSMTTGAGTTTADPAGTAMQPGMRQPSMDQPGMAGTAPNTGTVAYQPAQAAPAPAAQTSYPLCSRTVKDQCRQRGG